MEKNITAVLSQALECTHHIETLLFSDIKFRVIPIFLLANNMFISFLLTMPTNLNVTRFPRASFLSQLMSRVSI